LEKPHMMTIHWIASGDLGRVIPSLVPSSSVWPARVAGGRALGPKKRGVSQDPFANTISATAAGSH
jgi:hypothetical protein